MKTDVLAKRMLRAFRDTFKSEFQRLHGKKYYYWIPQTLRNKTKVFFTDHRYRFSDDKYDEHEFLLVRLVHNSKKGDIVTRTLGNFDENYRFRMLLKDIFGAKPNSKNLKEFF